MSQKCFKLLGLMGICLVVLALSSPILASDAGPQNIKFATFKTGSGWYIMAQTFSKIMVQVLPEGSRVDVLPYSGGVGNPLLLNQGKAQIALGFPVETGQAIKGQSPYKKKMPELKMLVGNLDTYWYLFSVRQEVPIKDFSELKAKKFPLRLVTLPRGSSGEWNTRTVLNAYGVTYNDIKSWGGKVTHVSFGTAVEMMKDGQADAFAHVSTPGHPSWTRLATMTKIRFLPIDSQVAQTLVKQYGFRSSNLPKGAFSGVDAPVPLLGFATCIITTDKMSNDTAYKITKAVCSNRDDLIAAYKGAQVFDPKSAANVPLPLHPGAKKYYQESGYLK